MKSLMSVCGFVSLPVILEEHYRGGRGGGGGGVECSRSVSFSFISEFVSASFLMHAIITWWLFTHCITSKLNKYSLSYRGLGGRPVCH